MHDNDDGEKPRTLRRAADPLRGAPPAGRWAIWHGPTAEAVLRLAQEQGRPATQAERAAVVLPPEMSAPLEQGAPAWVVELDGRRWIVRQDDGGAGYVSAYVGGVAVE